MWALENQPKELALYSAVPIFDGRVGISEKWGQ